MVGDVCEEDELKTGLRREGIFSSIGSFSRKMAVAVAAILTGNTLKWIGFDAETAALSGVPANVLSNLKISYVLGQTGVVALGLLLISFYPITRKRAMETQRLLRERRIVKDCADQPNSLLMQDGNKMEAKCPKCGSTNIQATAEGTSKGFGVGKGCLGVILFGPLGFLCGLCGMGKGKTNAVRMCLSCGKTF
jgi:hypothetical protein